MGVHSCSRTTAAVTQNEVHRSLVWAKLPTLVGNVGNAANTRNRWSAQTPIACTTFSALTVSPIVSMALQLIVQIILACSQ